MSKLTFDGFEVANYAMRYRGSLGGEYRVRVDRVSDLFKFNHADRIVLQKGPFASRGQLVVIGTTPEEALVLHDDTAGHAFVLSNCTDYAELCAKHDPKLASVSGSVQEGTAELGVRYKFSTAPAVLDDVFGLSHGAKVYFSSIDRIATVVGVFLNILWVLPNNTSRVVPLLGAVNEATLLSLHGMRDVADANTGSTSPRTPRTPGRSRSTPAFQVDAAKQVATCYGPFGVKIEVATDAGALKPFKVKHGMRLVATRGVDTGKTFTIVGVKAGSLYVHIEGERRVTPCRNCDDAAQLDAMYGFGLGHATSAPSSPEGSPQRDRSASPAGRKSASPRTEEQPEVQSPRRTPGAIPLPVWTSSGRVYFDTSSKGCEPFGFQHGQTVVASKGGDADTRFHIVGVRHGTLWAVPDGSTRATAFRHCASKAELQQRYGFKVVGQEDMRRYTSQEAEPAKTPMNSPRRSLRLPSAGDGAAGEVPMSSPLQFSSPATATRSNAPNVPSLALGQLAGSQRATTTASSQPAYRVAPETGPSTLPDVGPSSSVDRMSGLGRSFVAGQMPATRTYLKAYAHFKMGHTSAANTTAFHKFYVERPQQMSDAMASLPTFASHWDNAVAARAQCSFVNASVDELLTGMRESAHLIN